MRIVTFIVLACLAWLPNLVLADDDLHDLINELRSTVNELRTTSNQLKAELKAANARVESLELSVRQMQASRDQVPVVAATTAAGARQPVAVSHTQPPTLAATGQDTAKAEPKLVTAGDVKDTFKLPGSTTSLGFGGFVKMDVLFNSVSAGQDKIGDQYVYVPQIPVGVARGGEHSQIGMLAKESRLWFRSFTPSKLGDVNTLVEMDFYGAADAYTPRLRHAYGSLGNFLAGQTWSTFNNMDAAPETLDPNVAVGMNLLRQPQLRWTQPLPGNKLDIMLALEMPRSRISQGTGSIGTAGSERYPDIVMRLNGKYDWGSLSLAAMARQMRIANAVGLNRQDWGGALSLAGKLNVGNLDNLRFMFDYGNALSRYVTPDAYPDASLDKLGNMALNNVYTGTLAYQHYWIDVLRSTLGLSYSAAELPVYVGQTLTQRARSAFANLLWNPLPQVMLGLQYEYIDRELQNGQKGDLNRVEFTTRYNF